MQSHISHVAAHLAIKFGNKIYLIKIIVDVCQNGRHQIPPLPTKEYLSLKVCHIPPSRDVANEALTHGHSLAHKMIADAV